MNEEKFWDVIDNARAKLSSPYSLQEHLTKYRDEVARLSDDELKKFKQMYCRLKFRAMNKKLSEAAFVINNGCGDDDFENFLAGLIAQGQRIYYDSLSEPEATLLDLPQAELLIKCEAFDGSVAKIDAGEKNDRCIA